jgi:hypothetical protein
MTDLEIFTQIYLARLHATRAEFETPEDFASRIYDEAVAAWEEYEQSAELFDPETGDWCP